MLHIQEHTPPLSPRGLLEKYIYRRTFEGLNSSFKGESLPVTRPIKKVRVVLAGNLGI